MSQIYFASNFNSLGNNTRSEFSNSIDKDLFDFTPDEECMIAVKNIIIDKRLENEIKINNEGPHIIVFNSRSFKESALVQDIFQSKYDENDIFITPNTIRIEEDQSMLWYFDEIQGRYVPNISSNKQEIYYSFTLTLTKEKGKTGFIHFIYLKKKSFSSANDLVENINFCLKNIERDSVDYIQFDKQSGYFQNSNFPKIYKVYFIDEISKWFSNTTLNIENEYTNLHEIIQEQEFIYKLTPLDQPESLPPPITNMVEETILWEPHGLTKVIDQILDKRINNKFFYWRSKILTDRLINFEPDVMILESSFAPFIISSSQYKNQLCRFVFNDHKLDEITHYEFLNPSFFKTTKTRMSNAHFRILDSKTGDKPLFSRGSPTYIHCVCIPLVPNMKYPFSVFIDSADSLSRTLYPENTNTNFRIQLPERMSFNENWKVSLHGLYMTNLLDNIYSDLCWVNIYQDDEDGVKFLGKFELPSNYYSSIDELIQRLNILIKECPVKFSFQNKLITLWSSANGVKVEISQDLLEILGFDKKFNSSKISLNRGTKIKSSFKSNINI